MTTQSLKILFVISATRINKKGLVPLVCRITYLGKRKPFATGLFINPNYWNAQKQKAFPNNQENDYINMQISLIRTFQTFCNTRALCKSGTEKSK